jgi:hypothetical protein
LNWPRCFSEVYKKAAFKKLQALKFPVWMFFDQYAQFLFGLVHISAPFKFWVFSTMRAPRRIQKVPLSKDCSWKCLENGVQVIDQVNGREIMLWIQIEDFLNSGDFLRVPIAPIGRSPLKVRWQGSRNIWARTRENGEYTNR